MLRKLVIGLAVLLMIMAGAGYLLFNNLNFFVKEAIETYGAALTGTEVKVGAVDISAASGAGSISQLTIANPKDFVAPYAFVMGAISLKMDTGSLYGDGPVIIREIAIDNPQVTFEVIHNINSNLQAIANNSKRYSDHAKNEAVSSAEGKKPQRKIIIDDFIIRGGQIKATHNLLKGRIITAPLSTIHLSGIGKQEGGLFPDEAGKQVLNGIIASAENDAHTYLAKELLSFRDVFDKDGVNGIGNKLKGLLGK